MRITIYLCNCAWALNIVKSLKGLLVASVSWIRGYYGRVMRWSPLKDLDAAVMPIYLPYNVIEA